MLPAAMWPVLWEPFGFAISSFGVLVALGFLAGAALAARAFARAGLNPEIPWTLLTWCLVGGLLGAKLWYVAEQAARVPGVPLGEHLWSRGGLTWYGGMLGGIAAGVLGARLHRVPLKAGFDAMAPALALGQAIGRIGCFLVGDDYGARSHLPWAVRFPRGLPPTIDPATGEVFAVHPTMLYESAWLGLATLWLWLRQGRSPSVFGEYLILQGAGRLVIEHWRTNPALGPLSNAQWVALGCIAAGAATWLYYARRGVSPQTAA
jgi:phosphatidylglycerol:prolipoprotein diacylglycerol transferase